MGTRTTEVDSNKYWNPTGIYLHSGEQYLFRAEGTWSDGSNLCDADGWEPKWSEPFVRLLRFKRVPNEQLFKLIGAVNKSEPYITLGVNGKFVSPLSGELFCFANDVPFFYWNNTGKVFLYIERR